MCGVTLSSVVEAKVLKCFFPWCNVGEPCIPCIISNQSIGAEHDLKFDTFGAKITCFMFVSTYMSHFPNKLFKDFPALISIKLDNNQLRTWKREYLIGASHLKTLEIKTNPIEHFSGDSFSEALRLESLNIINTNMKSIDPNIFAPLKNLKTLGLQRHKFNNSLSADVFRKAQKLVSINLSFTDIEKFPDRIFDYNKKLQKLFLHSNVLATFDASLIFPDLRPLQICIAGLDSSKVKNIPRIYISQIPMIKFDEFCI